MSTVEELLGRAMDEELAATRAASVEARCAHEALALLLREKADEMARRMRPVLKLRLSR